MNPDMTAFRSLRSTKGRVTLDSRSPHGLRTLGNNAGSRLGERVLHMVRPSKVAAENADVAEQFVQAALENYGPDLADMAAERLQSEIRAGRDVTAYYVKSLIQELDQARRREIDRLSQATATLYTRIDRIDEADPETPFAQAFAAAAQETGMNVSMGEVDLAELLDRIEWAIMGAGRGREVIDREQGMEIAVQEIRHFLLAKRDALDVAMTMHAVGEADGDALRRFIMRRPETLPPTTMGALWERKGAAAEAVRALLPLQDATALAGVLHADMAPLQADLENDHRWSADLGGEMAAEETASMLIALGMAIVAPDAEQTAALHRLVTSETVNQMRGALRLLGLKRGRGGVPGSRRAKRMYMALTCLVEETAPRNTEEERELHQFIQNPPLFESSDDVPVEPRRALAQGAGMPLSTLGG